jgi:hypothetical protein
MGVAFKAVAYFIAVKIGRDAVNAYIWIYEKRDVREYIKLWRYRDWNYLCNDQHLC